MRIGVDTGGTFTDVVGDDGRVHKLPSTPEDPAGAVAEGAGAVTGDDRAEVLAHGTTIATNALLERRGGRVALVTNRGFADVIEIGRQDRPSLYDPFVDRPVPLVGRALRLEVAGRLAADGSEIEPVSVDDVPDIPDEADAVAVCLLHSDVDPAHERTVADALAARGHDVTASHQVSPEFREYERTVTTVANASLRPVCRDYLRRVDDLAERALVMTSAAGLVPVADAAESPVTLLLSGPAAGVRAGAAVAAAVGLPDAVTFDMGGTSTDVCLVRGGVPEPAGSLEVGGLPFRVPALDVHTVGAGGGSIAALDPGGALTVGPRSAGAVPGPACYGRGGVEPTVTDADLVLGRIPADGSFPGLDGFDGDAAEAALRRAGVDPRGVVDVVDATMAQAARVVTVERGVDPRDLALIAFGGAGPLHACAVADELGMPTVVIPPRAGVFSAVGLLTAPLQRELVRSWGAGGSSDALRAAARELSDEVAALVTEGSAGPHVEVAYDCRYEGQSHEIMVGSPDDFHDEHERRNGWSDPTTPVEVVALRARARGDAPLDVSDLPTVHREAATGPAVVAESDCTVWIPDGWDADVHPTGSLIVMRP
ncbi:MAG: hydantoinase/oxoprolinase family protein [Acidimicrobiia bacterium]